MKNYRHAPEQIIRKLREAEARPAAEISVPEAARGPGISEAPPSTVGETATAG